MRSKPNVEFKVHVARRRCADHARPRQSDDAVPRRSHRDALPVHRRGYRLHAEAGVPADRVRRRRGAPALYPIKRVNWDKAQAGDRRATSRTCRRASLDYVLEINDPDHVEVVNGFTRVRYAGTGFLMIRRHVFEKMCARLSVAAVLPRAFARCAGRQPEPVCAVRMHDRSRRPEPISARISRSASAGPISAAKSGPTSRAGSITSARRCSTAISRRSSPRRRWRPMRREMQGAARFVRRSPAGVGRADAGCMVGGIDLRPLWRALIDKVDRRHGGSGRGARSVADRATARRQAGGAGDPAADAGVASIVSLALFAGSSRGCACWRWRRRPTWAATRRSNFCWRIPASNCMTLYVVAGRRTCRRRCPITTSPS